MKKGILINHLELGYAPISAYTFKQLLKNDKNFPKYVANSHLYIIAQRAEITFNKFSFRNKKEVHFELIQENNPNTVKCILPIFQEHIVSNKNEGLEINLQKRANKKGIKNVPPYNGTQEIFFIKFDFQTKKENNRIWFTPEKLLQNYWKGHIKVKFIGDIEKLLNYKVHYVGKATEQNICNRLSKHGTFQDILSNEEALTYGNIPSNEIVVLLFRVKYNNTITNWGKESTNKEVTDYLLNYELPDDKTVSLDAEKVLVKHLQPEYNRILFKSYPKPEDLINKDKHKVIYYGIEDPICLVYNNGKIKGSKYWNERDFIIVEQ